MNKSLYHIDILLFALEKSTGNEIPDDCYKIIISDARDFRDELARKEWTSKTS